MVDHAITGRRHDVGCPFCGLNCDDLTLEGGSQGLRILEGACPISRKGFEHPPAPMSPMIDGKPVEPDAAVARAAEILAAARAPVFAVAADVAGTRAALRLADRLGAAVDHTESEGFFRNLRTMQDFGALSTTLSEVRNRADVVLMIGPDPRLAAPRFFERCIEPKRTLFHSDGLDRRLFRLGPPPAGEELAPPYPGVIEIACVMENLPRAIAALNAILRGREPGAADLSGIDLAGLQQIVAQLGTARYAVIVWAPGLLPQSGGDLLGVGLLDLARHLGLTTRASVLALGGAGNLFGVNQVCTWQSGYPLRTAFASGIPEHDPYRFSARRMVEAEEADALLWISAFAPASPPLRASVPTIVLAPAVSEAAGSAAVCIPVGTPGLDHGGQVFRTDGVVALRVSAQRQSTLPEVSSVVAAIEARLQGGAGR